MNRTERRDISVLRQYLLSYFSISLLSCCLIGILFFQAMARQMLEAQLEIQQEKLDQVTEDFQVQLDLLEGISHQISTRREFRPSYFGANKYYETELLDSLFKFASNSPFASEYFLYYFGSDLVYRSTGYSSDAAYFAEQILHHEVGDFLSLLGMEEGVKVLSQIDDHRLLLLYPIRTDSARQGEPNAVLCFVLSEAELQRRITTVTGGLDGALHIETGTQPLLQPVEAEASGKLHMLKSVSSGGNVCASLEIPGNALFGSGSLVRIGNVTTVVLAILLLMSVAGFLAWRNYLPIRRIHKRVIGQKESATSQNELAGIEEAFDSLHQNSQLVNQALLDQWNLLQSQLLRSLLNGDDAEDNLVRLGLLGVELTGPHYTVFYLSLDGKEGENPVEIINGLSGETLQFFAVQMGTGDEYAVICSMDEAYQAEEAEELLRAALEALNKSGGIGQGNVYPSPGQIGTSYLEAASSLRHRRASEDSLGESGTVQEYDPGYLLRLLYEIRCENRAAIPARLDAFESHLDSCAPSLLNRKYVYSQAISLLGQTVGNWGVPVDSLMLSSLLTARDNRTFREGLEAVLGNLAGSLSAQQRGEDDLSVRVLGYLRAHYLDYELSLDSMADEFHVTANYLGKLIKGAVGVTYKAYVTNLKIEEAKRLLVEGHSVAETGNRLGYSSTSHFIRVFRQMVDVTPSVYQKQHQDEC